MFVTAVEQLADLLHSGVFRVVVALGFINPDSTTGLMDEPKHTRTRRIRGGNHIKGFSTSCFQDIFRLSILTRI